MEIFLISIAEHFSYKLCTLCRCSLIAVKLSFLIKLEYNARFNCEKKIKNGQM